MDLSRLKLPVSLVLAALGLAAGSGGSWAVAGAKQARTDERVQVQEARVQSLEKEAQANRERVLRIELLVEQTSKTVERIDRKLDRR